MRKNQGADAPRSPGKKSLTAPRGPRNPAQWQARASRAPPWVWFVFDDDPPCKGGGTIRTRRCVETFPCPVRAPRIAIRSTLGGARRLACPGLDSFGLTGQSEERQVYAASRRLLSG